MCVRLCMCVCVKEEVYWKRLPHVIIETGQSKSAIWTERLATQESQWCSYSLKAREPVFQFQSQFKSSQAGDLELMVPMKSEGSPLENSLLLGEASLFILLRLSID